MRIIIGGSGMLLEASRTWVAQSADPVLLCGRKASRYQPILAAHPHAQFFKFDFSAKADYERLRQQLEKHDAPLHFLAWVHSPHYPYLANLLGNLGEKVQRVYLVKGSNSAPLPAGWPHTRRITIIRLGKHPTENRWLTHPEICRQVLNEMNEGQ